MLSAGFVVTVSVFFFLGARGFFTLTSVLFDSDFTCVFGAVCGFGV